MVKDHTGIFFVQRIRSRLYKATHLKTKRKFELRRASDTNQHWTAHELTKKGKKGKFSFADSRKSRNDVLENILIRMKRDQQKEIRKTFRLKPTYKGNTRFKPWKYAKLKSKSMGVNKTLYLSEGGEAFLILKKGSFWFCEFYQHPAAQPVAIGMSSREMALLELYYYLDIPYSEMTPADVKQYKSTCFKPRT